jgi:CheY-like chemotaxis protein
MFQPKPYILLIDDDEDDLELLSSSLELSGLLIKVFNAGDKAITYLDSKTQALPALIILDYNMPRINGEQVLRLLKSNEYTKNIPVIMYSTAISPIFKQAVLNLGAHACYTKPFSYSEFKTQVSLFKSLAFSSPPFKFMK